MADKAPIIIKKKKIVGGHGHHGGAWKVAYADFVTAMMAFFLVMWLMGSDDETKAAISHYFNHPNTPYKSGRDPNSEAIHPMGERDGEGESILNGMDGKDELVPAPVRPESYPTKYEELGELIAEVLQGKVFNIEVTVSYLKFSIPESSLFIPGKSQFNKNAISYLSRIGKVLQNFKGNLTIQGNTNELVIDGYKMESPYEASVVKAVAIKNYFVENNWAPEERVKPTGSDHPSSDENMIEFTLSQANTY